MRRPVIVLLLVAAFALLSVLGLSKMGIVVLRPEQVQRLRAYVVRKFESFSQKHEEGSHHEHNKIVVTAPKIQDVVITDSFVCQIRSRRHIEVRALEGGYLNDVRISEGQKVKKDDVMFRIFPVVLKARWEAEVAEQEVARMKYEYTKKLVQDKVVSENEQKLVEAEFNRAKAKADLALAELNFTEVKAPFDGIVDRQRQQLGSLVDKGDALTTLADNATMWVYFNVPEKYYLDYMATRKQREKEDRIELMLANGQIFPQTGTIGAIEADFNNENGNIKFRADYPNPESLLRHGQTGTIKIRRPLLNALLIPQRATFELLDKRYVWIVDENDIAHQTLVTTKHELEDVFVMATGVKPTDRLILEGVREVEDGGKVEFEFREPEEALTHQKFHAE